MSTSRVSSFHNGTTVYGTAIDGYRDAVGDHVTVVLWDGASSAIPVDTARLESTR